MSLSLPPLNAVRAFDAAARHNSFLLAAQELHVTPGAISQQVKLLEENLGLRLFERRARQVQLTAEGREFYQAISKPLRTIAQAAARLRPEQKRVRISTVPTFATRWLTPRMADFTRQNPHIEVSVSAEAALVDFERENCDIALRYAAQPTPGLNSMPFYTERVVPVCSPLYLQQLGCDTHTFLWEKAVLIHDISNWSWNDWLRTYHLLERNQSQSGLHFSHAMLAIAAAISHQGVTLTSADYVQTELQNGSLIMLDYMPWQTGYRFYLTWPKRPLSPAAQACLQWLQQQAEAT